MRQLTIRREKAWLNSGKTDHVYIEDPSSSEATIDGTLCHKLGELKNGGELSLTIGDEAARVFVVTGRRKKNKSSSIRWLPAGQENVILTGTHQLALGVNGEFQFIDDTSPEGAKQRKKANKRYMLYIIVFAFLLTLGRNLAKSVFSSDRAKEFTSGGMTITLTKAFSVKDKISDEDVGFYSNNVLVLAYEETFEETPGIEPLTAEEYAVLLAKVNGLSEKDVKSGEIPSMDYEAKDEESGKSYKYRIFIYKTEDAFWNVQFITFADSFSKYEEKINTWASSVRFSAD